MSVHYSRQPPEISASIFRAYDIRGIVGQDLTDDVMYWLGRAIASEMQQRGHTSTSLARDGRLSSPSLSMALQQGLCDSGCDVINLGAQPTGLLYYATHELSTTCGIMLTGSHNPANFNGLKIVMDQQALTQQEILALHQRIQQCDIIHGQGQVEHRSLESSYLERICRDIHLERQLTVVIDAGNGIAGPLAQRLMTALGVTHIDLYCEVDGRFPNHHPDPTEIDNLKNLQQAVQEHKADLGLAFDGDGDRVVLVDNNSNIIWADRLLMLLVSYILPEYPNRSVLFDVKSSRHLPAVIEKYGGNPVMWKTGHSLMKQHMQETDAIIGAEFSAHFYFSDHWYGVDDGLYTAARLLDIIGRQSLTTNEVLAPFPEDTSTPEITLDTTDERKFEILDLLRQDTCLTAGAEVYTIDGLRLEFDHGWGLIRPSNTTPKLTLRFAGDNLDAIHRIQHRVKQSLTRHAPELKLSF